MAEIRIKDLNLEAQVFGDDDYMVVDSENGTKKMKVVKVVEDAVETLSPTINRKADVDHAHTTSQITDFPAIPAKTSDLENDGNGESPFALRSQIPTKTSELVNLPSAGGAGFCSVVTAESEEELPSVRDPYTFYAVVDPAAQSECGEV